MPTRARIEMIGIAACAAAGKRGMANLRKPYVPIFKSTPARITLPCCRGLRMRIRQPGVDREHGDLYGKGEGKRGEQPVLRAHGDMGIVELEYIKSVRARCLVELKVEGEYGKQHEHAAGHGKEEELYGRVYPFRASPDADQQVHGDEHQLPEYVEKDKVEGTERSDHRCFEKEEGDVILLHPRLYRPPGAEHAEHREEGGEQNEQKADTVNPEKIGNSPFREPGSPFHELHAHSLFVEIKVEGY